MVKFDTSVVFSEDVSSEIELANPPQGPLQPRPVSSHAISVSNDGINPQSYINPQFFRSANLQNSFAPGSAAAAVLTEFSDQAVLRQEAAFFRRQQRSRLYSEVPMPVRMQLNRDSVPILRMMLATYRTQLGADNPVTLAAQRRLDLTESILKTNMKSDENMSN